MTGLSVNLNAVAQLRNRRDLPWPSVTGIARLVIEAGAMGITVHPRPDERHIRRSDVYDLKALLVRDYPGVEFNIEGYPTPEFLALVSEVAPEQVTLVPDDPAQATSDHGWDFLGEQSLLADVIAPLVQAGRRVSLFADPDCSREAIIGAREAGAHRIELFTGPYGACHADPSGAERALDDLARTAAHARAEGLGVNAGHDLTLDNLAAFIARVPDVDEVSIGHALTADALVMGYPEAVRRYRAALGQGL